ncbi:hypothetical protein GEMRC1_006288 [Eukaryota sp. GEM-RC1]
MNRHYFRQYLLESSVSESKERDLMYEHDFLEKRLREMELMYEHDLFEKRLREMELMYEHDFDSYPSELSDLLALNERKLMKSHDTMPDSDDASVSDPLEPSDLPLYTKFSVVLPDLKKLLKHDSIRQVLRRMYVKKSTGSSITESELEMSRAEAQKVIDDFQKSSRLEMIEKEKIAFHYLNNFSPLLQQLSDEIGTNQISFPDSTSMSPIFHYTAKQISTNYANNMVKNFHDYVFRFFNLVTRKKVRLEQINDQVDKKELISKLNSVRDSIIDGNFDDIPIADHEIFPNPREELTLRFFCVFEIFIVSNVFKKNIYYLQKAKPTELISHALYINRTIQSLCLVDGKPISVNNPFPMTKTLIPQHIRLDTGWMNDRFVHIRGKNADEIRKKVFDQVLTDKAVAPTKSFVFRYSSILTDGISCCLVLMRKDLVDEDGNTFKDFTAKSLGTAERYIHSLSNENIHELQLKEKKNCRCRSQ